MNPHRRLLLFAPSPEDDSLTRQHRLLHDHAPGLEDRDLLVTDLPETSAQAAAARHDFGVEPGSFTAVLVGKDGGAKHRSHDPIPPKDLFALVDAMPMRRREMG